MLSLTCPTHPLHKRIYNIKSNAGDEVFYCAHNEHVDDKTTNLWTADELEAAHMKARGEDNADTE
jgi:hypothetical protein